MSLESNPSISPPDIVGFGFGGPTFGSSPDFIFGLITTGIVIDFVPLLSEIKNSPDILQNKSAVFHTFEHLLIHAGNMLAGGISSDVDGISQPEQNRIIIFDRSANGGNGACKSLFLILEEVFKRANEIVNICNCDDGCPRCIQYYQCSEFNTNLRKDSVKTLFKIILKDEKF